MLRRWLLPGEDDGHESDRSSKRDDRINSGSSEEDEQEPPMMISVDARTLKLLHDKAAAVRGLVEANMRGKAVCDGLQLDLKTSLLTEASWEEKIKELKAREEPEPVDRPNSLSKYTAPPRKLGEMKVLQLKYPEIVAAVNEARAENVEVMASLKAMTEADAMIGQRPTSVFGRYEKNESQLLTEAIQQSRLRRLGAAKVLLRKAFWIAKERCNMNIVGRVYANISVLYVLDQDFSSALIAFRKATSVFRALPNRELELQTISNGIYLCIWLNLYDEALGLCLRKTTLTSDSEELATMSELIDKINSILSDEKANGRDNESINAFARSPRGVFQDLAPEKDRFATTLNRGPLRCFNTTAPSKTLSTDEPTGASAATPAPLSPKKRAFIDSLQSKKPGYDRTVSAPFASLNVSNRNLLADSILRTRSSSIEDRKKVLMEHRIDMVDFFQFV